MGWRGLPASLSVMALNLSILEADEAAISLDLPASIRLQDGQVIQGMEGESSQGQTLAEAGFFESADFVFRGLASRFTNPPFRNEKLTHVETGREYRIEKISNDPTGLTYTLNCVEVTR